MAKTVKIVQPYITSIPLTAEAREAMLDKMFADSLPYHGELLVPDDTFYGNQRGPKQAEHMVAVLCRWLGIKPGYIGLEFESVEGNTPDGQRHTVYVETRALWDEFQLGAALAYALTRYLIEERKQIHLPSADQPSLLATGSVVFGLGLVIMNGSQPVYDWWSRIKLRAKKPSGAEETNQAFEVDYKYLLRGFINVHGISRAYYDHSLTPWAAKKLGIKTARRRTHAVRAAEHKIKLSNMKIAGMLWLIILLLGITSFALYNKAKPQSAKIAAAQEHLDLLTRLTRECKNTLAYDRQYADLTDIQTVRSLNAVSLRCHSLDNQYQGAQRDYQQALEQ